MKALSGAGGWTFDYAQATMRPEDLRKGAALNAVQIAELLGRKHLKKG